MKFNWVTDRRTGRVCSVAWISESFDDERICGAIVSAMHDLPAKFAVRSKNVYAAFQCGGITEEKCQGQLDDKNCEDT